MITMTQMYWIVTLDSIVMATFFLSVVFLFGTVAAFGFAASTENHWWLPITSSLMLLVSLAVWTLTPSTKQMAAILVVPKIVNSEKLQTAGNRLYDLAVEWMDELRPENQRKAGKEKPDGK
jgi:hypothetical protein